MYTVSLGSFPTTTRCRVARERSALQLFYRSSQLNSTSASDDRVKAISAIFGYPLFMNISLTPELETLVGQRVRSGRYGSASEVVRDALRLLEERDRLRDLRFLELRSDVAAGVVELDRGESAPLDMAKIKAAGRRRLKKRSKR